MSERDIVFRRKLEWLFYPTLSPNPDTRLRQAHNRKSIRPEIVKEILEVLDMAESMLDDFIAFLSFGEPEIYRDKSTASFFAATSEMIGAVTQKIREEEK
jgi:hypothetical protein